MNQMEKNMISESFEQLKKDAKNDVARIYAQISDSFKEIDTVHIFGEISKKESEKLNAYVQEFTKKVKSVSIDDMMKCGCRETLTEAGWSEVQNRTGTPSLQYCRVNVSYNSAPEDRERKLSSGKTSGTVKKDSKDRISQMVMRRNIQGGVAGVGAAAIVVSIVVPGWNATEIALCAVGTVLLAAGGIGAAVTEKEIREVSKLTGDRGVVAKAPSAEKGKSVNDMLRNIIESQCRCNTDIICEWLDRAENSVTIEVDRLLSWQ